MVNPWKFVDVTWIDANSGTGWQKMKDVPEGSVCSTRGWLIKETPDWITVAATVGSPDGVSHEPEFNQVITIPQGCITKLAEC